MNRSTRLLLTGDKRAVAAIGALPLPLPPHRVACLEQLLGSLAEANGPDTVRSAVCAEPAVDKALAAACCCSSPPGTDPRPGLASYVEHLRAQAPTVLCVGSGLLA
ncbi:hypothetical protein QH494_10055 [Sphingomonas sp. AR_OL41]|uniref:hypothetical protein n=1 Tax=Sphingomonas sp. AR_OL41 TaxID=3042729 RepID=UPI0024816593|nr:hypothetical protein [Sphingomonas sp. AR_OL41]MDH7972525.1 hypothetical protein [Sphingomonas sp. AR_OL41]